MPHWPTRLGYARVTDPMRDQSLSRMQNVTLSANATAHEKGAYVELIASTSADSHFIDIWFHSSSSATVNTAGLVDLAVGSSFQEILVPNIGAGFISTFVTGTAILPPRVYRLPLYIPAGSRVGARWQCADPSRAVTCGVTLYGGFPPGGFLTSPGCDVLGANETVSRGPILTGNAVAHQLGAWEPIETSTPNAYKGFAVCPQGTSGTLATVRHLVDIGVGAAGFETVIIPEIPVITGTSEHCVCPDPGAFMLDTPVPAGSRLSARVRNSVASDASMAVHLLGVR